MDALIAYLLRTTAPFLAFAGFIALTPRTARALRLAAFILLFVVVRDAMTPAGLWTISASLTIRFIEAPLVLWGLAIATLGFVAWSEQALGGLRERAVWFIGKAPMVVAAGLAGALVIAGPALLARQVSGEPAPAAPREAAVVAGILGLTLFGNVLEEVLFRGHLHRQLHEAAIPRPRLILMSGGAFMVCHAHLAAVTTGIGWPVLAFTLYEGLVCAWLRERIGLAAACVTHGLGVFAIAVS